MSRIRTLSKGALLLLAGQAGAQLLSLLRNFVIARLIFPHDFGIAVTFTTTISLLNLISDMGLDKFVVQDRDGDDPRLQASLHALILTRGILTALALFVCAQPIATLFGVPEQVAAYRWLSLAPLISGFVHLDSIRAYRRLDFAPDSIANFAAQFLSVAVALALVYAMRDFRPMLWGLIAQSVAYTAASHLVANRRYEISFAKSQLSRLAAFAWPLTVNGLVLFAAGQGDRVAIGSTLGVRELAIYGAPALISSAISMVLIRVLGSLTLTILARARDNSDEFDRVHRHIGAIIGLSALCVAVPFMFLGPDIIRLLYGAAYTGPSELFIFVGLSLGLYVIGYWATVAALALGDSKNVLIVNIARFAGFCTVIPILAFGYGGLVVVAAGMAFGQVLGVATGILRLNRVLNRPGGTDSSGILFVMAIFAVTACAAFLVEHVHLIARVGICAAFVSACLTLLPLASRDYRELFTSFLQKLRTELGAHGRI